MLTLKTLKEDKQNIVDAHIKEKEILERLDDKDYEELDNYNTETKFEVLKDLILDISSYPTEELHYSIGNYLGKKEALIKLLDFLSKEEDMNRYEILDFINYLING